MEILDRTAVQINLGPDAETGQKQHQKHCSEDAFAICAADLFQVIDLRKTFTAESFRSFSIFDTPRLHGGIGSGAGRTFGQMRFDRLTARGTGQTVRVGRQ